MMNKTEFLNTKSVKEFINWIQDKLDKPGSFSHSYNMKRPAMNWSCDSIYSAFENYRWPFSATDPIYKSRVSGNTFNESTSFLSQLSAGLRQSVEMADNELCRNYCLSILEWGGVLNKNDIRVSGLGDNICQYLLGVKDALRPDMCHIDTYLNSMVMNSGFTKIYSLFIDDFIIYDGRVGAAVGLLVRKYCEDSNLDNVPRELAFAWGKGKESTYRSSLENKRNPSLGKYAFKELLNNPQRHTENNIRANWLLKELLNKTYSKFNKLDKALQLRALEAALFMIGYDVVACNN